MPMTQAELLNLIAEKDREQQEDHKRLRKTLDELAEHLEEQNKTIAANKTKIIELDKEVALWKERPVDAMKLVLTTRFVVGLLLFATVVVGGVYTATLGLKQTDSDMKNAIANIMTKMDAQHEVSDANARISQASQAEQSKAIDEIKRQQALQAYEIQNLKDLLQGRRPK